MRSKTQSAGETAAHAENRRARGSRAAQAAARVAARYANVPSYNEMLTREARAAVQAAEAASKAAQQAQAAFQYVLDGLEAANSAEAGEPGRGPELVSERHAGPVVIAPQQKPSQRSQIQRETAIASAVAPSWELEADAQLDETAHYEALPRPDRASIYDRPSIYERQPIMEAYPGELGGPVQSGEFAQPIHANLIEFPREMVATRRVRPRRAEGPLAEAGSAPQLSIFEVEPAAISNQPPPVTMDPPETPEWMRPEWPEMALEASPPFMNSEALPRIMNPEALPPAMRFAAQAPNLSSEAQPQEQLIDELLEEPAPKTVLGIKPAPMSRRLLAAFVDCTLIAAVLVAAATLAAFNVSILPGVRAMEFSAAVALLAIGGAYHMCFMILARATPGMKYAGVEIKTFSGYTTTRGQRCGRLLAVLLSVLPLGLGLAWALVDGSHLTWHDRLSKTYLRKR